MKKFRLIKLLLILLLFLSQGSFVFGQNSHKRPDRWATKYENPYLKKIWKLNDTILRSDQPDEEGFIFLDKISVKSVLNLRSHHNDKEIMGNLEIIEYNVEMKAEAFTDNEIIAALKIISNSPKPLVIHCKHGSDRTG